MAQVMLSLAASASGPGAFLWFKYDKHAPEVSFDKLRHHKEYALDIHPGNIFGVMPSGKNFKVVHKDDPSILFSLNQTEVKMLEESSAGWKGKIDKVSVSAGVGGKDEKPALPVIAPHNKPVKPKTKKPAPVAVAPLPIPDDMPRAKKAPTDVAENKTVKFRIPKEFAEQWMESEQAAFNKSKNKESHPLAIIRRSRVTTAQELLDLMDSLSGSGLAVTNRDGFIHVANLLMEIGEDYKFDKLGKMVFEHFSDALRGQIKLPKNMQPINKPTGKKAKEPANTQADYTPQNKNAITVTDKHGQQFTMQNRSGRKVNYVVVCTFPANPPTALSDGNPEKRDISGGFVSHQLAVKQITHLQRNFRVFDAEIIQVGKEE